MIAKFSLAWLSWPARPPRRRRNTRRARSARSATSPPARAPTSSCATTATALSKLAGKPVVVENKPGAQGMLATDFVAKSKPDGYTLMITPASSTLATAPHIFKKLPFDPLKDFAPVTSIARSASSIAVDAAEADQVDRRARQVLKSKPSHGFYGTGSNTGQVAAELFKERLGLSTVYVPYKVTVDALAGVVGGDVDFISYDTTWASTQHPQRGCASSRSPRRSAEHAAQHADARRARPQDFDITPWWGVVVPAGTPRPIIDRLAGWFNQITRATTRSSSSRAPRSTLSPARRSRWPRYLKTETERWER